MEMFRRRNGLLSSEKKEERDRSRLNTRPKESGIFYFLSSIFELTKRILFYFILTIGTIILLTELLVASPIDPVFYKNSPAIKLPSDPTDRLNDVQIFFQNEIFGPESITEHPSKDLYYVGVRTGEILEIDLEKEPPRITNSISLSPAGVDNKQCDGSYWKMAKCGRPLGIRYHGGKVFVADAYYGLKVVDFETKSVQTILAVGSPISNNISAKAVRYLNDFDFLPDGRIVLSESSTKFDDRDFLLDLFEHKPHGRILLFDPISGNLEILSENLYFPNGIQYFGGYVYFTEMSASRLGKLALDTKEIKYLLNEIPGYPDNIRLSSDKMLLIAVPVERSEFDDFLAENPSLRKYSAKILGPRWLHFVGEHMGDGVGIVIKYDPINERISDVLTGIRVTEISCVIQDKRGHLVMGGDKNRYIARLPYYGETNE